MWVRVVAVMVAAAAVAFCEGAAQAKQYQEVWNPPEARQAVKKSKGHGAAAKPAVRKTAAKGVSGKGGKAKPRKVAGRTTLHHAAPQAKAHAKLMVKGAPVGKPVKMAKLQRGVSSPRVKGASVKTVAHAGAAGHGHAQTVAMRAKSQKLAHKPASMPSTTAMAAPSAKTVPAQSATTMANVAPAANGTAGGQSLPPILH